jgi:hypothetical protein
LPSDRSAVVVQQTAGVTVTVTVLVTVRETVLETVTDGAAT